MSVSRRLSFILIVTISAGLVGLTQAVSTANSNDCANCIARQESHISEEEPTTLKLLLHLLQKMEAEQTHFKEEQTQLKEEVSRLSLALQAMNMNGEGVSPQEDEESILRIILQNQKDILEQLNARLPLSQTDGNAPITTNQSQNFSCSSPQCYRDCYDLLQEGKNISGVYTIYPQKCGRVGEGVRVWCDMEGIDGGWTVVLNRMPLDEQVDFNRGWKEYAAGFGDPETEYWIGNDVLHAITSFTTQILRVDMTDWDGETRYAEYNSFQVEDADGEYRLHLGEFSGTSGDAFRAHDNMLFSTPDRAHDIENRRHCAAMYKAGFWFAQCHAVSPTNKFTQKDKSVFGITWNTWHSDSTTLKNISFKLKRAACRG